MKIKELPLSERPYEKLELYGEKTLSNAELLAIIIKTGTREETSVEVAQKLLKLNKNIDNQDLNFMRDMSLKELTEIKGIGKIKAIQIKAVCELAIRMSRPSNYKQVQIKSPKDISNYLMEGYRFLKREVAKVVILNNKNYIIKIVDISLGGANFAKISIKDILNEAVKMQAPKILLAHNHPSGDSTPSKSDIEITERLYEASQILGIELVDHIVIGNMEYTSIFEKQIKEFKLMKG